MNVESPRDRLSAAPTRVNTRSHTPIVAAFAGTNEPICASSAICATCRMYVDLPAMFGPVISTSCSAPGSSRQSFGTKLPARQHRLDHRDAARRRARARARRRRPAGSSRAAPRRRRATRTHRAPRAPHPPPRSSRRPRRPPRTSARNSSASRDGERLLGGQHLLLELGELGRHVALAGRDRLLADVVRRHLREVRLRDLDVVTEHAVVADLEVRDAAVLLLARLDREDLVLAAVGEAPALVDRSRRSRRGSRRRPSARYGGSSTSALAQPRRERGQRGIGAGAQIEQRRQRLELASRPSCTSAIELGQLRERIAQPAEVARRRDAERGLAGEPLEIRDPRRAPAGSARATPAARRASRPHPAAGGSARHRSADTAATAATAARRARSRSDRSRRAASPRAALPINVSTSSRFAIAVSSSTTASPGLVRRSAA